MWGNKQARIRLFYVLVGIVFLILSLSASLPVQAQQEGIVLGSTVQVATNGQRLNLRKLPGLDQEIVARLENGTKMTVTGGPQESNGYVWWEIEGSGNRGWAAEQFLLVVNAPISPSLEVTVPTSQVTQVVAGTENSKTVPMADTYGFDGWCLRGWKWPSLASPLPIELDSVTTYNQANRANDWLKKAGFQSTVHKNTTAADALNQIQDKQVFFFYGHGQNNAIIFHDDSCQYSGLSIKEPEKHRAPQLKLALLLACETGLNTSAPDNILSRFRLIGARKAIGFNRKMMVLELNSWNDMFWAYAVQDEMEVGDAARKATLDAKVIGMQAVDPSNLVILGTDDVYLVSEKGTLPDINPLDPAKLLEGLKKMWNDLLSNLQRQLIAILEQEFQKFLQSLFNSILSYLNQCCSAPFGLVLFAALPLYNRWLRSRNEKGDRL